MSEKSSVNPKDVALYLAVMLSLYWSIGSLITLLFRYIDALFPDDALYYYDPYSGPIRFAMASLIIVFPVFVWLMRTINQDMRKHSEKRELGIRKWLLYLTVLIGGVIIVGDLIALVNNFLGGELTAPFLLKVLTLLVVVGGAFTYFFADLRGYWFTHEARSKTIGVAACVLVLASLVAGFFILGSPSQQRELRLDQTRINDLQNIQWRVQDYYVNAGVVPDSLESLVDRIGGMDIPKDPDTGASYEYSKKNSTTFELCATFSQPSPSTARSQAIDSFGITGDEFFQHEAGRQCFERVIDPNLIKGAPTRAIDLPMAQPIN